MPSSDRMVAISISGGSLYAATCNETIGQCAGSKRAGGRECRTRQVASQLSHVYEAANARAASSRSRSPNDAERAIALRPGPNVVAAANARYASADARNVPKNT